MSVPSLSDPRTTPALRDGDRLDRVAFHARYSAMPPDVRADLVGGIVYVASPLSYTHGRPDNFVAGWLAYYEAYTPGVEGASNVSVFLGDDSEVQPDQLLRVVEASGGRSRIAESYVVGPPELVVEVAQSSRPLDLGPKRLDYERAGVLEYLFVGVVPAEVRWFALDDGRYAEIPAGPDGLLRSLAFPGLWLDPAALLGGDRRAFLAALDLGLATPEHAAFAARLGRA